MGALPELYAATAARPRGRHLRGAGRLHASSAAIRSPCAPNRAARDEDVARRLWEVSEQLTGVRFELAGAPV